MPRLRADEMLDLAEIQALPGMEPEDRMSFLRDLTKAATGREPEIKVERVTLDEFIADQKRR